MLFCSLHCLQTTNNSDQAVQHTAAAEKSQHKLADCEPLSDFISNKPPGYQTSISGQPLMDVSAKASVEKQIRSQSSCIVSEDESYSLSTDETPFGIDRDSNNIPVHTPHAKDSRGHKKRKSIKRRLKSGSVIQCESRMPATISSLKTRMEHNDVPVTVMEGHIFSQQMSQSQSLLSHGDEGVHSSDSDPTCSKSRGCHTSISGQIVTKDSVTASTEKQTRSHSSYTDSEDESYSPSSGEASNSSDSCSSFEPQRKKKKQSRRRVTSRFDSDNKRYFSGLYNKLSYQQSFRIDSDNVILHSPHATDSRGHEKQALTKKQLNTMAVMQCEPHMSSHMFNSKTRSECSDVQVTAKWRSVSHQKPQSPSLFSPSDEGMHCSDSDGVEIIRSTVVTTNKKDHSDCELHTIYYNVFTRHSTLNLLLVVTIRSTILRI